MIPSYKLKQVLSSLVLSSFATQLSRKEGNTISKLESSKFWNVTIVLTQVFNGNLEFIINVPSETFWKFNAWKTGGLIYFPTALTSLAMTQPADNNNSTTARHLSTTVSYKNDVSRFAADMQTQNTERHDNKQVFTSQHNAAVNADITNDEKKSQRCNVERIQFRSRDFVTVSHEEPHRHFRYEARTVNVICLSRPSTGNNGNQDPAPFPEGIIFNCGEMEIICPDEMECSHMVAHFNSGGNGTTVNANQETETYVHWHLSSHLDFMTVIRMTFDEFIAEQREQLLQPNKSASTIKLVDQCDRADNTMCKIFLIYQIKHYPEAVKAINGNSIGTRPLSRPRLNDYPRLTSDRTTNPNSNIALKADILLTIPRIQRKISNDDEQTIKDSDHIMRVADSAQGGIACELTFDDLRFSPNNFMSKIDKPTSRVYISAVHGTDRLKVVGNGLDNHKMCLGNDKPLLTSSMSARYKPDGKVMIEGKEYINELYNSITTIRTKTPEPIDCEDRYKEPREKPRTCSTAHAKRYIFSSSLDIPASEDEYGSEGLQLRTMVNAIASFQPTVLHNFFASPWQGRDYDNPRKTIESSSKGRASNDSCTSAQRRGRMSPCIPLIAGASLHHGLPGLHKQNYGEMCSNKMIRRTTHTFRGGGRRTRHRIDNHSGRTCRRRRGNDHTAPRPWRSAPTSPPGGVFRHLCLHLFEIYRLTSQGTLRAGSGGLQLTSVDRPPRATDQAGLDHSGRIISPAPEWDAENDAGT